MASVMSAHRYGTQLQERQPGNAGSKGLWVRDLPGADAEIHRTTYLCVHWNRQCFQGRLAEMVTFVEATPLCLHDMNTIRCSC